MPFSSDFINRFDRRIAKLICGIIPASCPFEQDVLIAGMWVAHIPPLCKLNPFYELLVMLRFETIAAAVDRLQVAQASPAKSYSQAER